MQPRFTPNRLLISLLVAMAVAPCASANESAAANADGDALPPLDCVINPSVVADLGSSVPGVLSSVRVDRSDLIEQGQVVAELESSVETVAVELARARAEMDAEINLRRVNAAFGQRQHRRTEDLYQRKVISTNDMDERQTEARLASLQLRQALENQQLAELERRRAEKVLNRRIIQSPISGVVMERFKTIGEYVEDQPVVRVAQLDPLHVEVFVPVQHLGGVREGMQAEVWSEAVPDNQWEARVTRVDRVADVASGTYGVRLELPNPDYKVPAGLRCQVQFVAGPAEPVVTDVPAEPNVEAPPVGPTDNYARAAAIAEALARAADREATARVESPGPTVPEAASTEITPSIVQAPSVPEVSSAEVEGDVSTALPADPTPVATLAVAQEPSPAADMTADVAPAVVSREQPLPLVEEPGEAGLLPVAEAAGLPRCQTAGPFDDEASARRQARTLRSGGLEAEVEARSELVQVGVRVVTERMPSRAAATDLHNRLQKAGISDLYIVTRGKYKDRVALGLYKHERPARERADQVAALGFQTEVRPWLERKNRYFLTVRGMPTAENARLLGALPVPTSDGAIESGTCDQLASR